MELEGDRINIMLNLYFLLGEKKPFNSGEELLINILERLSLTEFDFEIDYCYKIPVPSRKDERRPYVRFRREQLEADYWKNPQKVIVGMGPLAAEVLANVPKTKTSQVMGLRYAIPPFLMETWFTYDPSAALYDPNLYVDITGTVATAIRSAGRQIIINQQIRPFEWPTIK